MCPLCLSQRTNCHFQKIDPHHGPRDYYQCGTCQLVFLDPSQHLDIKGEKKRYDTHQNSPEDNGYLAFLNRLTNPLLTYLKPDFRGLDFGCGPGPAIKHILGKEGYEVVNYDPIYFPQEHLLQTQYDFVTATEVVEHLRSPRNIFQLLKGLLKPNTSCLGIMTQILEPNTDFPEWWYHKDPTHICFYQKKTFEWLGEWLDWKVQFPAPNVVVYTT